MIALAEPLRPLDGEEQQVVVCQRSPRAKTLADSPRGKYARPVRATTSRAAR